MFFNILATLVVAILTIFPLWIYLGARYLLSPEGFWRKVLLLDAGLWILGFIQIVLLIVGLFMMKLIWSSYFKRWFE